MKVLAFQSKVKADVSPCRLGSWNERDKVVLLMLMIKSLGVSSSSLKANLTSPKGEIDCIETLKEFF